MKALIFITFLTFVGIALVVYSPDSKAYWENVGPQWNKILNPDTYNDRTSTSN